MSKKELEARTKRFALSVIKVVSKLPRCKASDVIGYQLLKSGTSIGANYREVNRAELPNHVDEPGDVFPNPQSSVGHPKLYV